LIEKLIPENLLGNTQFITFTQLSGALELIKNDGINEIVDDKDEDDDEDEEEEKDDEIELDDKTGNISSVNLRDSSSK
jgi:hypothetical protein